MSTLGVLLTDDPITSDSVGMESKRRGGRPGQPIAVTPAGVNVLRALRERLGLTQVEVADRARLDRSVVAYVELGRNKLGLADTRKALARGLYLRAAEIDRLIRGNVGVEDVFRAVITRNAKLRARLEAPPPPEPAPPVAPN